MEQLYFFNSKKNKDSFNTVFMVSVEKLCVVCIVFLLLWIMAFFLGYRRGIRIAAKEQTSPQGMTIKVDQVSPTTTAVSMPVHKEESVKPQEPEEETAGKSEKKLQEEIIIEEKVIKEEKVYYSIQLATYKNTGIAQWHLKKLKEEGLNSFLEKKGPYYVLYVGKFSSRGEAQKILGRLRQRFPDCLIRRL